MTSWYRLPVRTKKPISIITQNSIASKELTSSKKLANPPVENFETNTVAMIP
jgi:hypothetical protein